MNPIIIKLDDTESVSFTNETDGTEDFYSEAGGRGRARRQARRMTKISNKQERRSARKSNRQENRENRVTAKGRKKGIRTVDRMSRKTTRYDNRQSRKQDEPIDESRDFDTSQSMPSNQDAGAYIPQPSYSEPQGQYSESSEQYTPPTQEYEDRGIASGSYNSPPPRYKSPSRSYQTNTSLYDEDTPREESEEEEYDDAESFEEDTESFDGDADFDVYNYDGVELPISDNIIDIADKIVWNDEYIKRLKSKELDGDLDDAISNSIKDKKDRIQYLENEMEVYINADGDYTESKLEECRQAIHNARKKKRKAIRINRSAKGKFQGRQINPNKGSTLIAKGIKSDISHNRIEVPSEGKSNFSGDNKDDKFKISLSSIAIGVAIGVVSYIALKKYKLL
jgi:hypothetical protein